MHDPSHLQDGHPCKLAGADSAYSIPHPDRDGPAHTRTFQESPSESLFDPDFLGFGIAPGYPPLGWVAGGQSSGQPLAGRRLPPVLFVRNILNVIQI